MEDLFSVSGKTAIVTGGSTGIGAMIAEGFVRSGVKTYITARKQPQLDETAARLSEFGECIAIQSDLSTMEGVEGFAESIKAQESEIDFLINNAGASWGADLDEFPESGWDKVMDLNVKSIFFLTQKLLPLLREGASAENRARVVNIASINGITHPGMNNYSYGASKAAVIQLTRHIAPDLAPQYINVNGIAPGYFPSKMTKHLAHAEMEIAKGIPVRKIPTLEDAAGTAIYLCSRASDYVSGHTLVLDGGVVAGS